MLALLVILAVGLYVATRTGDVFSFLIGGGLAGLFIVFAVPHMPLFGGH